MTDNPKTAVLLLAHGTPETIAQIPEYLRNVTSGRPLPDAVVDEVKHRYSLIGHSPLTEITERQAELLENELGIPVYVGMRNWRPYISDTVRRMREAGITRMIAICMAPHNSRTSVGLYKRAAYAEAGNPMEIQFIDDWHDHPLLIRAFAESLRPAYEAARQQLGAAPPVLFTAHSVPTRTVADGDPYEQQARATAALVASKAGIPENGWRFAFQSQGMSGGPWIGPTVEENILALKALGHKGVLMQAIGFVCDHVEVLYDIDIGFRQFAQQQGMKLWRAPSLNDSPLLIAALAELVQSRLHGSASTSVPAVQAE